MSLRDRSVGSRPSAAAATSSSPFRISGAELLKMRRRAGEMEECGAGGRRRRTADADLDAVRQEIQAPRSAVQRMRDVGKREHPVEGRARIGRGCDDLDVADHVLPASQRSHGLGPVDSRCPAQRGEHRIRDRHGAAERHSRDR